MMPYQRQEDKTLQHRNITLWVSDGKDHTTVTVFAFLKVVLKYLKTELPAVKKIHYFTDGCAGQCKNKNNISFISHHEDDFGLAAEWNFFATSYGKSTYDGIGGTVKRPVTKASFQRPYNDQILTSDAIINFCNENIHVKITCVQANESDGVEIGNEAADLYMYRNWWMKSQTSMGTTGLTSCIHMGQQDRSIGL